MDKYTLQEQAWKNGFEAGYVRRTCDDVAEAMKGSVEWYEGIPKEDLHVCFIFHSDKKGQYTIRPAVYKKNAGVYLATEFEEDGEYFQRRIAEEDVRYYARVTNPFTMRISFTVPEAH